MKDETLESSIMKKITDHPSPDRFSRYTAHIICFSSIRTCKCGAHAGHALKCPHGRKSTVARFERHTLHSRWRSKSTYILEMFITT